MYTTSHFTLILLLNLSIMKIVIQSRNEDTVSRHSILIMITCYFASLLVLAAGCPDITNTALNTYVEQKPCNRLYSKNVEIVVTMIS